MDRTFEEMLLFQLLRLPQSLYSLFRDSSNTKGSRTLAYWIVGAVTLITANKPKITADQQFRLNSVITSAVVYLNTSKNPPKGETPCM